MPLETIRLTPNTYLNFQHTPWNDLTVGGTSWEITMLVYESSKALKALLEQFEEQCHAEKVTFVAFRYNSTRHFLKGALIEQGYYFAEHTLRYRFGLQTRDARFWKPLSGKDLKVLDTLEELEAVEAIATSNFFHGRFHEDPYISLEAANQRNSRWVHDAYQKGQTFLLYYTNEAIVAFLLLEPKNPNEVELYFGGSRTLSAATPKLLASGFKFYAAQGYQHIYTNISAANLGILNILGRIGGKAIESWLGYHKFF